MVDLIKAFNKWFDLLPEPKRSAVFFGCIVLPTVVLMVMNPTSGVLVGLALIVGRLIGGK